MPDSRRSLHLRLATLIALLGLQLASCADVQSGPDQAPPGIETSSPITHQTAQLPPSGPLGPRVAAPITGGPQIALLLPLTGAQSAAAISVRDGFLSAYYSQPAAERPGLRIYDTAQMSIAAALNQATGDGAGLIVGPLTRTEATAAAGYSGPRPPILILNAITGAVPAGNTLYQFALSPEEEARQVARRVIADGNRAGVALVPSTDSRRLLRDSLSLMRSTWLMAVA